ncbi:Fc receptor-like protein 5 isoform X4 [Epinephelus moara]|uniref:Fc receptor-like protein 5 isoform X2 n=1 Tax=Epinephelus moara TaxID=300413 RepID=UPI00214E5B68|nr:Fc receptor-like protein 5 isoform X2 [Epinephelus moara]XP_049923432.1 Fc receptor-like protein 5 isoform X4 [Epinephelus moara]
MKAALLCTLLCVCPTSVHSQVSVTVTPGWSQFFEYGEVSLGCDHAGSGKWSVWRYSNETLKMSQCGLGMWGKQTPTACIIKSAKTSDSGVYWCQSKYRDSSNTVNITVTDQKVILQSPVLPVMEGDDVTLRCRTNKSSSLPAVFKKDNSSIHDGPHGHMTIYHFNESHEGAYSCKIGSDESPHSWLLMKDDSEPVLLTVSPDSSQMFEYKSLSLSCGDNSSSQGWKIIRSTTSDGKISSCGGTWGDLTSSGCDIQRAKQTDSATYWCASPTKQRSNSLDITIVPDTQAILQIPVLPVTEGDNVTLICRADRSSNLSADFYKDGSFIRTEPTGHMTNHNVSISDGGLYKCDINGVGESRVSQLFVRDRSDPAPSTEESTQFGWGVIRHIVVPLPYLFSTFLMVCEYRRRLTGSNQAVSMTTSPPNEDDEGQYDDMADVTTEHRF